jgi:3,4-dihydroxy-2-butanone 4-phosphate synthase
MIISVSEGIECLANGKPIIIFDENNEHEGDMVVPADIITIEHLNFMLNECKGVICQTLPRKVIERLEIPIFTKKGNSLTGQTNFIYPVDHVNSETGISSKDRLMIIKEIISDEADTNNLVIPGHQNLLKITDGGVIARQGHTESSSEMVTLAGYTRSAVICEIIDNQGVPMGEEGVADFSEKHDIPVVYLGGIHKYFLEKNVIYISPTIPFTKNPFSYLSKKRAIVTGGSSGIGLAVKELLQSNDCEVIDISRSSGFDVTDYETVNNKIDELDNIDFLIYCAGHIEPKKITDMTTDDWHKHMDVNLNGAFNIMNRSIPKFNGDGIIINVISPCAKKSRNEWSGYCSSKAGLHSLTMNAAEELNESGIKVFGVSPSKTDTPMIHRLFDDLAQNSLLKTSDVASLVVNVICRAKTDDINGVIYNISKNSLDDN